MATLGLWLILGGGLLPAQDFFFSVTTTPDTIVLGSNLTYQVSVTNATGENLNPGVLLSEYNANAEFVDATNRFAITNEPGRVFFVVETFAAGEVFEVELVLRGTNVGQLTNTFTITIDDEGRTEPAVTNVVSSIDPPPEADLGISIEGPANGVFPGDAFQYRLIATNAGPDPAAGVVVSNALPPNTVLLELDPADQLEAAAGSVRFTVGTLTNQGVRRATISLLATNAGPTNLIVAEIHAPTISDTNTANNRATSNVPILSPVPGQIVVTGESGQELNPQTGWMEQRVRLENVSTSGVAAVRLLVEGLTNPPTRLVNVAGTNGSTPYVAHGAPLGAGAAVDLVLEYFSPTRTPVTHRTLQAYGTPPLDLTPETGAGIEVERIELLAGTNFGLNAGRILLEWPAAAGAAYQVIYDDQAGFGAAKGSLPKVQAAPSANRVQWLDYGPPRTLTAPSNASTRFYKVIQLP